MNDRIPPPSGYPGGPLIEKKALRGNSNTFNLPHPLEFENNLNFSFSGIKTAVSLLVKKQSKLNEKTINDIAASFQNKIIEILKKRTINALNILSKKGFRIKDIAIVGGVAANKKIYGMFNKLSKDYNCRLITPPQKMYGDNAAMIALTCLHHYKNKKKANLNFKPNPRWALGEIHSL